MDNKKIGERIRRLRSMKGLSQANVAEDLGITSGAYAKIERGDTDANVSRLLQIAKVLEVNITDFFEDAIAMEQKPTYGFVSKDEFESLHKEIRTITKEIEKLKSEIVKKKIPAKRKK